MFPEERKNKIVQLVIKNKSASVVNLAKIFNVSEETIRRDLKHIQEENIIKKTYGVATLSDEFNSINVTTIQKRKLKEHKEKMAIAKEAIKLLYDKTFILLDAGSTTECIAKKLKKHNYNKNVSIITNGLNVAEASSKINHASVFLLGGELQNETLSIVGPLVNKEIKNYNIDIAFLGATGISIEDDFCGFYSSNIYEVEVKKAIVSSARVVVVVADHTKFGKHGLSPFCNFENIDYLITSDLLEKSILEKLTNNYKTKLIITKMNYKIQVKGKKC